MNPLELSSSPPSPENRDALRERLARQLFETDPPELAALLAHGPWNGSPPRPTPAALLDPVSSGLKRFRISW
ncbi:MAG: hypothetical protein HQL99_00820 [Magnetococcales bacterium]|nr:hypothetical protein [Magnetococcales bacterium]